MREIKYRGWNDEQMLNVVRIHLDADGAIWWSSDFKQLKIYNAEHKPFMQYTGLKDKNGKEIYEGDMVKILYWSDNREGAICIGKVIWDDEICGFQIEWLAGSSYSPRDNIMPDCEIIGNIYENSELLKKI